MYQLVISDTGSSGRIGSMWCRVVWSGLVQSRSCILYKIIWVDPMYNDAKCHDPIATQIRRPGQNGHTSPCQTAGRSQQSSSALRRAAAATARRSTLTPIRFIPVARGGRSRPALDLSDPVSPCSRHAGPPPGLHIKRKHSRTATVNTTIRAVFAARGRARK